MQGRLEIGQQIETEIVAVTDTPIFLDLNAKSEGVLDRAELVCACSRFGTGICRRG